MTNELISESIFSAPDFWGTTLRMAMITDSASHTAYVITDLPTFFTAKPQQTRSIEPMVV